MARPGELSILQGDQLCRCGNRRNTIAWPYVVEILEVMERTTERERVGGGVDHDGQLEVLASLLDH